MIETMINEPRLFFNVERRGSSLYNCTFEIPIQQKYRGERLFGPCTFDNTESQAFKFVYNPFATVMPLVATNDLTVTRS